MLSDDAPVDYIITGGVDDLVKVWELDEDGHLKLKHQLEGHSLGIVSVAISNDGRRKYCLMLLLNQNTKSVTYLLSSTLIMLYSKYPKVYLHLKVERLV